MRQFTRQDPEAGRREGQEPKAPREVNPAPETNPTLKVREPAESAIGAWIRSAPSQ